MKSFTNACTSAVWSIQGLFVLILVGTGCASSDFSSVIAGSFDHEVRTIAIGLDGEDLLSDAITTSLRTRGFSVVDRLGVYEILSDTELRKNYTHDSMIVAYFKRERERSNSEVDVFLTTKSIDLKTTGQLGSVTINLYSTHSGAQIQSFQWKNGWGGMQGSPADSMMSKDIQAAAEEIVSKIVTSLGR